MVAKYNKALEYKASEVDALKAKLKEIPMKELLVEEAKSIKNDVTEVTTSIKALTERLNAYAAALKAQADSAMQK
ncbi:MAG: hypothetical protein ACI9F2_000835 [Lysobacterales bacterium]|jgi:hypothetical protein